MTKNFNSFVKTFLTFFYIYYVDQIRELKSNNYKSQAC